MRAARGGGRRTTRSAALETHSAGRKAASARVMGGRGRQRQGSRSKQPVPYSTQSGRHVRKLLSFFLFFLHFFICFHFFFSSFLFPAPPPSNLCFFLFFFFPGFFSFSFLYERCVIANSPRSTLACTFTPSSTTTSAPPHLHTTHHTNRHHTSTPHPGTAPPVLTDH